MSLIKKNIFANFTGNAWTALMSLAFVPLYIKFMGIESYGLVGIFTTLQGIFNLLDLGLAATLNRELAKLSGLPDKAQEMRNLVRTLEIIYWGIGLFIALVIIGLSSPLTYYWVKADQLPVATVHQALMIMGGIMAFQWPLKFYAGGLNGLQRQVLLNGINIGVDTFRRIGVVLILWQVSPTIQAFFIWQILISIFQTSLTAAFLWSNLPKTGSPSHFQKQLLFGVWRFAAGMTGISITGLFLSQTDKVILSKLLPLKMFGYYILATVAANTLYHFGGAVSSAVFPRFSQLIGMQDQTGLKELYHKSCQFMSVMILPPAIIVAVFSSEILLLWTGNPLTVENTHNIVTLRIIGVALHTLLWVPGSLQFSHGWTKLVLYSNIILIIVIVPMMIFLTIHYGAVGAAFAWIVLYGGRIPFLIRIMHSRFLKGEQWRWYLTDVGKPLFATLIVVSLWRIYFPIELSRYILLFYLVSVSITALGVSVLVTPYTRYWGIHTLMKLKVTYGKKSITRK